MIEYNAIYDPLSIRRNEKDEWDTAKTDRICIVRKNPIFAEEEQSRSASEVTACRDWTGAEQIATRSSEEERRVDALALRADERRDKLR